jgi:hypothetical protein
MNNNQSQWPIPRVCVWSWSLDNEETLPHQGLFRHEKKKIKKKFLTLQLEYLWLQQTPNHKLLLPNALSM